MLVILVMQRSGYPITRIFFGPHRQKNKTIVYVMRGLRHVGIYAAIQKARQESPSWFGLMLAAQRISYLTTAPVVKQL